MNNLSVNLIISILFLVIIIAVVIFTQIKLSRNKNKYLGLILPLLAFSFSILAIVGIVSFTVTTISTTDSVMVSEIDEQSGEIIKDSEEIIETPEESIEVTEVDPYPYGFLNLIFIFLVTNVPTVILGGIYVSEKNKIKVRNDIEKMKISDL